VLATHERADQILGRHPLPRPPERARGGRCRAICHPALAELLGSEGTPGNFAIFRFSIERNGWVRAVVRDHTRRCRVESSGEWWQGEVLQVPGAGGAAQGGEGGGWTRRRRAGTAKNGPKEHFPEVASGAHYCCARRTAQTRNFLKSGFSARRPSGGPPGGVRAPPAPVADGDGARDGSWRKEESRGKQAKRRTAQTRWKRRRRRRRRRRKV